MSESIEYKGFEIKISQDEFGSNPRTEWDNLGTMVCFHGRYELGDKNHGFSAREQNSFEELADKIKKEDIAVILPLYLYDHSGITMSTGSFSCRFDSGQVGFIYITKEKARKEFGIKQITKAWIKKLTLYLESEVETYDQYLTGNVYHFDIEDCDGVGCGGFYGSDHEESGLLDHARGEIDAEISYKIKQRVKKVKEYIKAKVPVIYRVLPSL